MKAFDLLTYLLEHLEEGSVIGLTTSDNIPFMLSKDSDYEVSIYVCKDENVKRFKKKFDKPTLHRVALEILDEISGYLGKDIEELNINNNVKFEECLPKKAERKPIKKTVDLKALIEEMRKLPKEYELIPLFTENGKLLALVIENLALISFDKIVKTISRVSDGNISPINPNPVDLLYVLSTLKFDLQKGNPFSSYDNYTFFTAFYIDMGEIGEGEFLGRRMYRKQGKFYTVTSKGSLHPLPLEFLDLDKEKGNSLYIGYFIHDGNNFVKLNAIDLLEYHKKGTFTINAYIFSSFLVTQRDFNVDYQGFDKLVSGFVNNVLSKGVGAKYVKDVFEREGLLYEIPLVKNISGNTISIVDPISFWYYRSKGEEVNVCESCEVKDKVELWNKIIKNYYREFLL